MTLKIFENNKAFDATLLNADINYLLKQSILNSLNHAITGTSGAVLDDEFQYDLFASDTAATKTNWTYNATDDTYENTQTSQAILAFTDILSDKQKNALGGNLSHAAVYFVFDDAGEEDATVVSNAGFETAGGGGADVFADWTEATGWNQSTSTGVWSQQATHATEGSTAAYFDGRIDDGADNTANTLTQNIDLTGIKYLSVDYYAIWEQDSGALNNIDLTVSATIGAASDSSVISSSTVGVGVTDSGTLIVDVSAITSTENLVLSVNCAGGWGSRVYLADVWFDNVQCWEDGSTSSNLTRAIELTADGSNWESANNGELHAFSNAGTSLGVRITETRTDGSTAAKDVVKSFGVFFD